MNYFEIYVPGKHGYSLYVKTEHVFKSFDPAEEIGLPLDCDQEEEVTRLAVKAKVLDWEDAAIVKYVVVHDEKSLQDAHVRIEDLKTI
jgi:hypothetical protein